MVKRLDLRERASKLIWINVFHQCVPEWVEPYNTLDREIQTVMHDTLIEVSFINGSFLRRVHPDEYCLSYPWAEHEAHQQ